MLPIISHIRRFFDPTGSEIEAADQDLRAVRTSLIEVQAGLIAAMNIAETRRVVGEVARRVSE